MMAPIRISILLLLLAQPMLSAAQTDEDPADKAEQPRRYTIEVIVFRYAQEVSIGSEIFPPEATPIDPLSSNGEAHLIDGEQLETIPLVPRKYPDIGFTPLMQSEYTMGDVMDRLRRLDVYEPLMHIGWTQATWPNEETLPIELGKMGAPPPALSGTLRLYLNRYLHLEVDLELEGPKPSAGLDGRSDATMEYGDYRSLQEQESRDDGRWTDQNYGFAAAQAVRYRIEEDRILRSGELRYFDHPKFGVLAKVVRVEEASEPSLEAQESELLGYPAQ